MFSFFCISCSHLIAFFNHCSVIELLDEFVVDRGKMRSKRRMHSSGRSPREDHGNHLWSVCETIMEIVETNGDVVDVAVKMIVENLEGPTKRGGSSVMPS